MFLEGNKIRCWVAPRDIVPGTPWGEAIIDAIAGSRVFVLIFSSHSNSSPQVIREVERAVNKQVPIIPFRIEDSSLSKQMEYFISTHHWLDALTSPVEEHIEELSKTIAMLINSDQQENKELVEDDKQLRAEEDNGSSLAQEDKGVDGVGYEKEVGEKLKTEMALLAKEEEICRKLSDDKGIAESLMKQADLLAKYEGSRREAVSAYDKVIDFCETVKDIKNKIVAMQGKAIALKFCGDLQNAVDIFRAIVLHCKENDGDFFIRFCATQLYNLGGCFVDLNEYVQAIDCLSEAESLCMKANDQQMLFSAITLLGEIAIHQEDWKCALEKLNEAINLENILSEDKKRAGIKRAKALWETGLRDDAYGELKEIEEYYREANNRDMLRQCCEQCGHLYFKEQQWDEAFEMFSECEMISREQNESVNVELYLFNQYNALYGKSQLFIDEKKYDKASEYIEKGMDVWNKMHNADNLLRAKNDYVATMINIGAAKYDDAEHKEAYEFTKKAIDESMQINNSKNTQISLNNASVFLSNYAQGLIDRQEWEQARKLLQEEELYFEKIGAIDKFNNSRDMLGVALSGCGLNESNNGNHAKAIDFYRHELKIWRDNHQDNLNICLRNLSKQLSIEAIRIFNEGELQRALELFQEEQIYERELGDIDTMLNTVKNEASTLKAMGMGAGSLAVFKEYLRLSEEHESKDHQQIAHKCLEEAYFEKQDWENALHHNRNSCAMLKEFDRTESLAEALVDQATIVKQLGTNSKLVIEIANEAMQYAIMHGKVELIDRFINPLLESIPKKTV